MPDAGLAGNVPDCPRPPHCGPEHNLAFPSPANTPPAGFGALAPADFLASRTDEAGGNAPNPATTDLMRYKISSN